MKSEIRDSNYFHKIVVTERFGYALNELIRLNIEIDLITDNCIEFTFNNERVKLFPFTGWHSGKSIKDGRSIKNLINQLT